MRIEQAEELLKFRKAQGPVSEPLTFHTDEGIALTLLPPGNAQGCFWDLMGEFGKAMTYRPKLVPSALFIGYGEPHKIQHYRRALWPQEYYVYQKEMRSALARAVECLDSGACLPRIGESNFNPLRMAVIADIAPHPEDFQLFYSGVRWHEEGERDVPARELFAVKKEFEEVLQHFIEEH